MKKPILTVLISSSLLVGCLVDGPNIKTSTQEVKILPLREVKDINFYIEQIKADSSWMDMIEEKAKKLGISVDEMLKIDAEYLEIQEVEIVKIENDIIKNADWLELIKQKAIERKVSLDEMIRIDATFVYQEKIKQNIDTTKTVMY